MARLWRYAHQQAPFATGLSSTGVEQWAALARTSDGQMWVFYSDILSGTNQQLGYRRRTATNTFSAKTTLPDTDSVTGLFPVVTSDDVTHFFYTNVLDESSVVEHARWAIEQIQSRFAR